MQSASAVQLSEVEISRLTSFAMFKQLALSPGVVAHAENSVAAKAIGKRQLIPMF